MASNQKMAVFTHVCIWAWLVSLVDSQATQLAAGREHSCAILFDGSVKCWGNGISGRLGYGDSITRGDGVVEMGNNLSTVDLGSGRTAKDISAGHLHTCAILDDDTVKCWGDGSLGKLGYGDTDVRGDGAGELGDTLPAIDLGTGRTAVQVSAGDFHTCAVLDDATVKCWGEAGQGQLGSGDTLNRGNQPNQMGDNLLAVDLGSGHTALQVSAGFAHTCVLLDGGTVKCWGNGANGRLGYGDTGDRGSGPGQMGDNLTTVDLGSGRTAVDISTGFFHTCATLDNGSVKCWGLGTTGQLGYGDANSRGDGPGEMGDSLPSVDLGTGRAASAKAVGAGLQHTCATFDSSVVKCWGLGSSGQLGSESIAVIGDGPGEMGNNLLAVNLGTGKRADQVAVGSTHVCVLLEDTTVKCWGFGSFGALGYGDTVNRGGQLGSMGDNLPTVELLATGSPTVSPTNSPSTTPTLQPSRSPVPQENNIDGVDPAVVGGVAGAAGTLAAAGAYLVYVKYLKVPGVEQAKQLSA